VYFVDTEDNFAEYNNIFDNSIGMEVDYNEIVNAEKNYWGDSTGPYHESLNPEGNGNPVNGDGTDLDFIPFLTSPVEGIVPELSFLTIFLMSLFGSIIVLILSRKMNKIKSRY
jgi:hypothetical protein